MADEKRYQNEPGSERPELAHVLFMDLVRHSELPMEEQRQYLSELQQIVRAVNSFREADKEGNLICLPTGDGMALVFFQDLFRAVECAIETAKVLKARPYLKLRIGLNVGPVYRVADINTNLNVSGGGINVAQRVMDAGDAGHILLSFASAEMLSHLGAWKPFLRDLGEHQVKHGIKIRFYNLCTPEAGSVGIPEKLSTKQKGITDPKERTIARLFRTLKLRGSFTPVIVVGVVGLVPAAWVAWHIGRPHPSVEAWRWYDEGIRSLRDGTYYTAMRALERAVQLDSSFSLAHARLAEASAELEYDEKAKTELLEASVPAFRALLLTPSERLRFQAAYFTVMKDFTHAIEKLKALEEEAAADDKAGMLVEVGRAYENSGNIPAALKSYTESAKLNNQYAAAFLRRGILYRKQQDLRNASDDFDRAQELYRMTSNAEGLTEVLYQRCNMLTKMGRMTEAQPLVEEALRKARSNSNEYQEIRGLLQFSNILYMQGDVVGGQHQAEEAIDLARQKGIEVLAASGLTDLGAALYVKGDYSRAEPYLRNALELAKRLKSLRVQARACLHLGGVLLAEGRNEEGLAFTQQAVELFREGGFRTEAARALIPTGRALADKGDYSGAGNVFRQQIALGELVNDQLGIALAQDGLGDVLIAQEDYPTALQCFDKSMALNQGLGDQLGVAYSELNRSVALWMIGRYSEAGQALDHGRGIADKLGGNRPLLADIYATRAAMALSQRNIDAGKEFIQKAKSLGEQDNALLGNLKVSEGLAQVAMGRLNAGLDLLRQSIAMARTSGNHPLLTRSQLATAECELAANHPAEALSLALDIHKTFGSEGQIESKWRVFEVIANAAKVQGLEPMASKYDDLATSALTAMRQQWGQQAFEGFMSRQDIQLLRSNYARIRQMK
jgi:tetratricopeptide (TPR) repeat protein/class 3 adenylate cyclase